MSLNEIAQHAGVSIATVSRVLNKNPRVRPATAQRVWNTIERMRINVPVRRFISTTNDYVSGRTGMVTLALLGGINYQRVQGVFLEVISGVVTELQTLGLQMLVNEIPAGTSPDEAFRRVDADGAIVLGQNPALAGADVVEIARRIPAVWVMGPQAGPTTVDHVVPHSAGIGDIAFRYLRDSGCSRFAYLFQEIWAPQPGLVALQRAAAFGFAANVAGFPVDYYLPTQSGATPCLNGERIRTAATSAALVDLLLASLSPDPEQRTGVFLSTDSEVARLHPMLLARGVCPGTAESGLSLIGCDNDYSQLMPLVPRPATIDINLKEVGRQAVRRLMRRIRHPEEPPLVIELPPRLVEPRS